MPFGSEDITCSRSQYGIFEQGVNNISLFLSSNDPDGSYVYVCGWAQPANPLNPNGDIDLYMGSEPTPEWIIDTDYETFVSTYTCVERNIFTLKYHWQAGSIYTRDPNPSQETVSISFPFLGPSKLQAHSSFAG